MRETEEDIVVFLIRFSANVGCKGRHLFENTCLTIFCSTFRQSLKFQRNSKEQTSLNFTSQAKTLTECYKKELNLYEKVLRKFWDYVPGL
jgi:hypothetical protein